MPLLEKCYPFFLSESVVNNFCYSCGGSHILLLMSGLQGVPSSSEDSQFPQSSSSFQKQSPKSPSYPIAQCLMPAPSILPPLPECLSSQDVGLFHLQWNRQIILAVAGAGIQLFSPLQVTIPSQFQYQKNKIMLCCIMFRVLTGYN